MQVTSTKFSAPGLLALPQRAVGKLKAYAHEAGEIKSVMAEIPFGNGKEFVTLAYNPATDTLSVN